MSDLEIIPRAREIEEALIGSVLVGGAEAMTGASLQVREQTFGTERYRPIWRVVWSLYQNDSAIDYELVAHELEKAGDLEAVGGYAELTRLATAAPSSLHAESYAEQALQAAGKRAVLWTFNKTAKMTAGDADLEEILEAAQMGISKLTKRASGLAPLQTMTAHEMLIAEWPDSVEIIGQLLTAGLAILAGKSKLGKSWLVMQIAKAVGTGGEVLGQRVDRHPVLVLALEDHPRRLVKRMRMQEWPPDADVDFMTMRTFMDQIGDLKNGGGQKLASAIEDRGYKLVIIDTLSRSVYGDQNDVDKMTRALSPIQEIAQDTNSAILMVDHHNKYGAQNKDVLLDILGSTAKGAVSDTGWGLYRERGKAEAQLMVTGRDIVDQTLALDWDAQRGLWLFKGDAYEIEMTERRAEIMSVIGEFGPSAVLRIAEATDQDKSNTRKRCNDLVNAGALGRKQHGRSILYYVQKETPF